MMAVGCIRTTSTTLHVGQDNGTCTLRWIITWCWWRCAVVHVVVVVVVEATIGIFT